MAILKDLIVHGSSRFLNKIYASEIQTPLIDAEAGIFKKLKADDATVVGLLDVQGQMHTNSWTNSNIATIDGSFYITPTIECASGTLSSLTVNTNTPPKHSFVLTAATGSSFAVINSLYYYDTSAHTVTWAKYSKVLITGEILVGGEWIPLGTILGQLNADGASGSISIINGQNNKHGTSTVLAELTSTNITSAEFRNLKISLYQRSGSTTTNTDAYKYPLGIYLTALGQNGKTFLDIYGGVNALTTSYGGYANPNVRIGNLSGLPAITTAAGNFTPVGWGIYTTNGYFSGTIVSNTGVIGGWKLGANSLYNETTGLNDNTVGIYLGIDGIRNYQDINTYVNITEGVIEAKGVNLTGTINATAGNIGGFQIDSSSIHTNNVAITSNVDNSIALSSADFTRTINNTSRAGLRFAIGDKFGVTGDGTVYASDVDLTGKIIATSGTIGGIQLDDSGKLWITDANISGTISASHIDVSSISIGSLNGANNYAQKTDVTQAIDNVSTIANTALGQSVWYAECSTTAGTAVKVATISPVTTNFVLTNGITVNVKFVNTNSASGSSLQLNVNETGAKNIKYIYNGTYNNIQSNYLKANQMYQFRYDGIYWIVQMMYDINYYDRSLYEVALQASEAIPSARIAVLGLDGKLHLLNNSSFRISCPLLYVGNAYSADNVTNSFSRSTNYTYWGTSFNLANTHSIQSATANTNVYVVGTLSGDIFTPNTTVLTCAEPTTEDGLYYMLLGRMTSTTYAILQAEHPIYIYKNGKFQKLEATTATSYITYIDANNGIKIHNESDTLNYLQLNSTAISMYRNNIETLNISNDGVRVGKLNENNIYIDNDSVDIRNGQTILSSFGNDTITLGEYGKSRLQLSSTSISGISWNGVKNFNIINGDSSYGERTIEKNNTFTNTSSEGNIFNGSFTVSDSFFYFYIITATVVFSYILNGQQKTSSITLDVNDPVENETPVVWIAQGQDDTSSYILSYQLDCSMERFAPFTYLHFNANAEFTPKNTSVSFEMLDTATYSVVIETKVYQNSSYTFGSRVVNSEHGQNSFAIGEGLVASSSNQIAVGRYNNDDSEKNYAFMVGNGFYGGDRSNAFAVDWSGHAEMGDIDGYGLQLAENSQSLMDDFINCIDVNDNIIFKVTKTGNAVISNDFTVSGNETIDGGLNIRGGLTVGGNETITGDLTVGSNETVTGSLTVGGNETLTGILTVNNNVKVKGRFLNSAGNPLFKVVTAAKDNITISANNGAYPSITVSAAGYTPVAIAQVHLANATNKPSSYAHYTWVTCSSFALSGSTISCYTGNWNTSTAVMIKLTFKVLCILNTAL